MGFWLILFVSDQYSFKHLMVCACLILLIACHCIILVFSTKEVEVWQPILTSTFGSTRSFSIKFGLLTDIVLLRSVPIRYDNALNDK